MIRQSATIRMFGSSTPARASAVDGVGGQSDYEPSTRRFQGIPGVELVDGGLLVTFYSGGEGEGPQNYVVLAWYDPRSDTLVDPLAVVDPPGQVRAFDPGLWIDPGGTLWWYWNQSEDWFDGVAGVWVARCRTPQSGSALFQFEEPRRISDGIMMNNPTIVSAGSWAFPVALWRSSVGKAEVDGAPGSSLPEGIAVRQTGAHLLVTDGGEEFALLPGPDLPERHFDEHVLLVRLDGSFMLAVRTHYGIGRAISHDGGRTWSAVGKHHVYRIGPSSRFALRRLRSGRVLLVYHEALRHRSHLTAYLSDDDGESFPYHLVLDDRRSVSYPDVAESDEGRLWIVYDRERTGAREILLASISEADILDGALSDAASFTRRVITSPTSRSRDVGSAV